MVRKFYCYHHLPVSCPVLADVPHTPDEELPLCDQDILLGCQCLYLMGVLNCLENLNCIS